MYTLHGLYRYINGKWVYTESPQSITIKELLDSSAYFYLLAEDLNGIHALKRVHLDNCTKTDTIEVAVNKLVLNSPVKDFKLSLSELTQFPEVVIKNGLVTVPTKSPLVFNTTTSFLTRPFDESALVIDYLDNVVNPVDLTLGTFDNTDGFIVKQLSRLEPGEIEASLLKINNVVVKTTDYFYDHGTGVALIPNRTEALMALLVEARLSPREIGIYGHYKHGVFFSRRVCATLIKHPDMQVLINPTGEPVELRRTRLTHTIQDSEPQVVFCGNKPTTLRSSTIQKIKETKPVTMTASGEYLDSQEAVLPKHYLVELVYPQVEWLEAI